MTNNMERASALHGCRPFAQISADHEASQSYEHILFKVNPQKARDPSTASHSHFTGRVHSLKRRASSSTARTIQSSARAPRESSPACDCSSSCERSPRHAHRTSRSPLTGSSIPSSPKPSHKKRKSVRSVARFNAQKRRGRWDKWTVYQAHEAGPSNADDHAVLPNVEGQLQTESVAPCRVEPVSQSLVTRSKSPNNIRFSHHVAPTSEHSTPNRHGTVSLEFEVPPSLLPHKSIPWASECPSLYSYYAYNEPDFTGLGLFTQTQSLPAHRTMALHNPINFTVQVLYTEGAKFTSDRKPLMILKQWLYSAINQVLSSSSGVVDRPDVVAAVNSLALHELAFEDEHRTGEQYELHNRGFHMCLGNYGGIERLQQTMVDNFYLAYWTDSWAAYLLKRPTKLPVRTPYSHIADAIHPLRLGLIPTLSQMPRMQQRYMVMLTFGSPAQAIFMQLERFAALVEEFVYPELTSYADPYISPRTARKDACEIEDKILEIDGLRNELDAAIFVDEDRKNWATTYSIIRGVALTLVARYKGVISHGLDPIKYSAPDLDHCVQNLMLLLTAPNLIVRSKAVRWWATFTAGALMEPGTTMYRQAISIFLPLCDDIGVTRWNQAESKLGRMYYVPCIQETACKDFWSQARSMRSEHPQLPQLSAVKGIGQAGKVKIIKLDYQQIMLEALEDEMAEAAGRIFAADRIDVEPAGNRLEEIEDGETGRRPGTEHVCMTAECVSQERQVQADHDQLGGADGSCFQQYPIFASPEALVPLILDDPLRPEPELPNSMTLENGNPDVFQDDMISTHQLLSSSEPSIHSSVSLQDEQPTWCDSSKFTTEWPVMPMEEQSSASESQDFFAAPEQQMFPTMMDQTQDGQSPPRSTATQDFAMPRHLAHGYLLDPSALSTETEDVPPTGDSLNLFDMVNYDLGGFSMSMLLDAPAEGELADADIGRSARDSS